MENIKKILSQMTEDEKENVVMHVEICRDFNETKNLDDEDVALYDAIIEERVASKAVEPVDEIDELEKLVIEAKALAKNAPDGFVVDGDTILCDIMEEADFEITGLAADIFDIWLKSSDRKSVEKLFYDLTDVDFEDFVNRCLDETTRND